MRMLILIIALLAYIDKLEAYTLELTESELQTKISQMMPIEKSKYFVTVVLSHPDIDLAVGDNKLGIVSNIALTAPGGVKGSGTIKITGEINYVTEEGAFYVNNAQIVSFESQDIAEKMLPKVHQLAQVAVQEFLARKPVYRFKDDELKQKLAKAVLQSIKIENHKLIAELGLF